MPKKLPTSRKQVSYWILHFIIFLVANAILWYVCYQGKVGFVYPWPAWITAAWGLCVIGHACIVWSSYEDTNYNRWLQETKNG